MTPEDRFNLIRETLCMGQQLDLWVRLASKVIIRHIREAENDARAEKGELVCNHDWATPTAFGTPSRFCKSMCHRYWTEGTPEPRVVLATIEAKEIS